MQPCKIAAGSSGSRESGHTIKAGSKCKTVPPTDIAVACMPLHDHHTNRGRHGLSPATACKHVACLMAAGVKLANTGTRLRTAPVAGSGRLFSELLLEGAAAGCMGMGTKHGCRVRHLRNPQQASCHISTAFMHGSSMCRFYHPAAAATSGTWPEARPPP